MVLPGGAVGLLPCVGVVVAVGVAVVGAVVGELVRPGAVVALGGATVGGGTGVPVGTTVGGAEVGLVVLVDGGGVDEPLDGVLDCSVGPSPGVADVGLGVCAAASTGALVGPWLPAAGAGISGVSRRGPPSRLLPMRIR
ncbi:MAG TPA: hypothetical protein VG497_18975 [Kribbella sp.]|nr:hypothetical protein [Kribbella sp.]